MYYACVCAIAKDDTPHLREWALHHFAVGFEHIVLYDNGSAVPAARTLADLADAGLLTVIDFPRREAPQLSAYYHCLRQWKTRSRWLAFIDIDEFVLPLGRRDVRDLLEDYEAWAGLAAHWMVFGSGGHLRRPPAGVTRSYTDGLCLHHHVKSLVQPQWVLKPLSPHHFAYAEGRFCVNEDRVPVLGASSYPVAEKIRINHYFYKSQQDFEEKIQRGLATAVCGSDGWTLEDFYRQSSRTGTPDMAIAPFLPVQKAFGRMPPEELAAVVTRDCAASPEEEIAVIATLGQSGDMERAFRRYARLRRYQATPLTLMLGANLHFMRDETEKGLELLGAALFAAREDAALRTWIYEEIGRCYSRLRKRETAEALKRFLHDAGRR